MYFIFLPLLVTAGLSMGVLGVVAWMLRSHTGRPLMDSAHAAAQRHQRWSVETGLPNRGDRLSGEWDGVQSAVRWWSGTDRAC